MAERDFKKFTITTTNTPQPLIGTTLSAAVSVPRGTTAELAVADSSMFQPGDWAVVSAGASAVERLRVESVPDGTHINVFQMQNAHASGDYVSLGRDCLLLYIQTIQANAGPLYVGNSGLTVSTLVGVMAVLYNVAGGQPVDFLRSTTPYNQVNTADYWIAGTSGDGWLPSFVAN